MAAIAQQHGVRVGAGQKLRSGEQRIAAHGTQRGHPFVFADGSVLLPTVQPEKTKRVQPHMLPAFRDDVAHAVEYLRTGQMEPDPRWSRLKHVRQIRTWFEQAKRSGMPLMIDIETAGLEDTSKIRCIGVGQNGRKLAVIPLFKLGGRSYWSDEQHHEIKEIIRNAFDSLPLEFQNGAFDTRLLLAQGYMTGQRRTWDDLAIMHHDSRENDCRHTLAFISARTMMIPLWKGDVDHKAAEYETGTLTEEEQAKREDEYHLYNARDVHTQMVSMRTVRRWKEEDKTDRQYEVDKKLAPIARDMGALGLTIDMARRDELADICRKEIAKRITKLQNIVAKDFNPESHVQVGHFIYTVKRCPEFAATGEAATEDETGSTGEKALLKILDHGVDKETETFINRLLEYRGYSKLLGTYLSDKHIIPHPDFKGLGLLRYSCSVFTVPTGRFATSPNIQNWPSRGVLNIKSMVVPPPGHLIIKSDFDQIEARIFAALARDEIMLKALAEGLDLHSYTAGQFFSRIDSTQTADQIYERLANRKALPPKEFKRADLQRAIAKTLRFGSQYGAGEKRLYMVLSTARDKATNERLFPNIEINEAKLWARTWDAMNPWIKRFIKETNALIRRQGYAEEDWHGRKRFFKDGAASPNEAPNMRVQGHAAGMTNDAMLYIDAACPHRSWSKHSGIFAQVHDELAAIAPESRAEEMQKIMNDAMQMEYRDVAITAQADICERWST